MRRLVRLLLLLGWLLALPCCRAESSVPELIELTGLEPRALQLGDRLTLTGSGFPPGRAARLSFYGDLFRPGRAVVKGLRVEAAATTPDPHTLSLLVSSELMQAFAEGTDPGHATFRGSVLATFGARSLAAPLVRGSLDGVVLDLSPDVCDPKAALDSHAEAGRFAEHLGFRVRCSANGDELVVDSVDPRGRAARAGLMPSDVLLELDGLRLESVADLVPAPRTRLAQLLVRHTTSAVPERVLVDANGFQPGSPAELVPVATWIALVAALLLWFASPVARAAAWLGGRLAAELEGQRARARASRSEPAALSALAPALPSSPLPYLALVADAGVLSWLALGRTLFGRELDVPLVYVGSLSALLGTAFVCGGRAAARGFSMHSGLRLVLCAALLELPMLATLACALAAAGSFQSDELSRAQGALPWQWLGFANPLLLAVLLLCVLARVPVLRAAARALPEARCHSQSRLARAAGSTLAEWSHLIVTSGLLALLLLGGTRLPEWAGTLPAQALLGLWLFGLKGLGVFACVLLLRLALGAISVLELGPLGFGWLAPASVLVVPACQAWNIALQNPVFAALRTPVSVALCAWVLVTSISVALRALSHFGVPGERASVSPWI